VLFSHAAELAVERASDEDIARLRVAAEATAEHADVETSSAALLRYFVTLAEISGNPLLFALCRFISQVQIGLAVELSKNSDQEWGRVPRSLVKARMEIVDAIARRDATEATGLVRDYHRKAMKRIQSSPGAQQLRETDPGLTGALARWLSGNVSVGG
jgi:DNA-binding FadR family transcriptional regulator